MCTTNDLKQLAVEMDWTRFYSELYRTSDTDERWAMKDMLRVLNTADAYTDTDLETDPKVKGQQKGSSVYS